MSLNLPVLLHLLENLPVSPGHGHTSMSRTDVVESAHF